MSTTDISAPDISAPDISATAGSVPLEAALVELGTLLLDTTGVRDYLGRVAALTERALDPPASCGVSLYVGPDPVTVAASGYVAGQVEETQYEVGAGPCVHTMRTGEVVHISDLGADNRWPDYRTHALALGLRSTLSMPITDSTGCVGALNVHARAVDAFGPTERRAVELFTAQASAALELLHRQTAARALTDQLREALDSRAVIDQAMGIIMATRRCDPQAAFGLLRRTSQNSNRKLRDVATDLVAGVSRPVAARS